jgi:RimJ/RimL family protein N-acetyltransferase
MLETERLRLRPWRPTDADAFAAMNADPEVMADLGGPYGREASDAKLARYAEAFERLGYTRWLAETRDGAEFVGYIGLLPVGEDHPLAPSSEIGWRLVRSAWCRGYATEAARAALADAFGRLGLVEVAAFTSAENHRSQAVMARLGMTREPHRDFEHGDPHAQWKGLVWIARPADPH